MVLYLAVSADKYEFPIAVADSAYWGWGRGRSLLTSAR